MAKDYTISINYLERLLDMLAAYPDDETIIADYEKLNDYISRLKNNYITSAPTTSLINRLSIDYGVLSFFKPYYPLAKSLTTAKYHHTDFYSKEPYHPLDITTEETIKILKDFFKQQGEFFYSQFLDFLDEAEDHLEYISPNNSTDGEILFIKSLAEAFVSIANYPNICKLSISSHEFTHVIDAFNNPNFHEQLIIRELSSMFMEIIASDYFAQKLNLGNDNIKRRAYLHGLIKDQAMDVIRKTQLLHIYGKYQDSSKKRLFSILRNNGFNKKNIETYEKYCLIEDYYYIIAQLIAIELYFIYLNNQDYALIILEDIIMNGTDNNILNILQYYNINLTNHLPAYEDILIKGLKK